MPILLVTGASGFVGRHVVASSSSFDVVAVEHRWSGPDELRAIVGAAAPTACIHLGWHADPADYLVAVGPNARSLADTLELADVLVEAGCRRLVVAGSSAEYAPSPRPVVEADPVTPNTVYGSAKALCHELLRSRVEGRMSLAWARLFNVVGPGEPEGRIVPTVTRALLAGSPIDLSEGVQVRDYIDVRDVASALVALAEAPEEGPFNVSTGVGTPLREMLVAVAEVTGGHELLRFGARPIGANENLYLVGDNGRLRSATNWAPRHAIPDMAHDIVEHWKGR